MDRNVVSWVSSHLSQVFLKLIIDIRAAEGIRPYDWQFNCT